MHSLTSSLDGGEWSAPLSGLFTPRKRALGTNWIGGWEGPRTVLDAVVKLIKISRKLVAIIGQYMGAFTWNLYVGVHFMQRNGQRGPLIFCAVTPGLITVSVSCFCADPRLTRP
jgi:hypothetical protein